MKVKCKACEFEFESIPKREIKFGRMVFETVETCELCVALKKIQDAQLGLKKLIEEAKIIAKERKLVRSKKTNSCPEKTELN